MLRTTPTTAVDVQPLVGLVVINVYPPGAVVVAFCVVDRKLDGPSHLNVAPEAVDVPSKVTDDMVQFNCPDTAATAPGFVLF
jgi:hypothetical protein